MSRNSGQEVEGAGPYLGPSPQSWESSRQRLGGRGWGAPSGHTHIYTHTHKHAQTPRRLLGSLRTRQPLWAYPRLGHVATSCHQNRGLTNLKPWQGSRRKRTAHTLPKEAPAQGEVWNSQATGQGPSTTQTSQKGPPVLPAPRRGLFPRVRSAIRMRACISTLNPLWGFFTKSE